VTVDHRLYLRDRSYRRARHAEMRRLVTSKGVGHLVVVHEDGGSCCDVEPWPITLARLVEAGNADGIPTLGIVL